MAKLRRQKRTGAIAALLPARLLACCALHLAVSVSFAMLTPSFEKPDEPGHLDYIRFLAVNRRLPGPLPAHPFVESAYEGQQPPLYYVLQAAMVRAIDPKTLEGLDTGEYNSRGVVASHRAARPGDRKMPPRPNPDSHLFGGKEARIFESDERDAFPYRYPYSLVRILRFAGIPWGLLTVVLAYHLGVLVFGSRGHGATVAAALAALNPQFCFLSGSVSNDGMAVAAASLVTYLGVRHALTPVKRRHPTDPFLVGAALGIALLVKLTVLPLAVFIILCLLAGARWRWGAGARAIAAGAAAAVVVSGWYFVRNAAVFGDLLGQAAYQITKDALVAERSLFSPYFFSLAADSFPALTFKSFWGYFGWMNVPLNPRLYHALALLCAAGVLGVAGHAAGALKAAAPARRRELTLVGLLSLHALLSLAITIRFNLTFVQPQGRYLFGSLLPLSILLLMGFRFWTDRARDLAPRFRGAESWTVGGLALFLLVLNAAAGLEMARQYWG